MSTCLDHVTKKLKATMKIGTHDGGFHCDELLACFMLTRLPPYKDADIVRYMTVVTAIIMAYPLGFKDTTLLVPFDFFEV